MFGITRSYTKWGFIYILGADGPRYRISALDLRHMVKCPDTENATTKKTTAKKTRAAQRLFVNF